MSSLSNNKRKSGLVNALIGCSISILALWWVLSSIEGKEVATAFGTADLSMIFCAFLATVVSYALRAYRWPFFFKSNAPQFWDAWRCLILGFFMNNVLPARLGEFVRAHLGGKATRLSRTRVLATIAAERLVDGLTISVLFAVLFTISVRSDQMQEEAALFYVAYGFAAVSAITFFVIYKREFAYRILERLGHLLPGKYSQYSLSRVQHFIEGLEPLLHLPSFLRISGLSVLIWTVELSVYLFVSVAFHQSLSLGGLVLFLAVVNFSSLIPAGPGGVGTIEAFATMALVHIGVKNETALAMVISQHVIQILVVGLPGAYYFIVRMHGKIPEPVAAELGEDGAPSEQATPSGELKTAQFSER